MGKEPGADALPAEFFEYGGAQMMDMRTLLFQEMWRQGQVPQNFSHSTIVHSAKEISNNVTITEASRYSTAEGESSLTSSSAV
ncbi:unnamed protein product [Schistocephalus solidus]|uniref:Uncharacterized protein n=1 Tax=Schistocephalus solidus TaxID=70667 RepID=A0A183SPC8_SCHSO|nr:unnamed protein product [Schistocephalus solidus]